jgi:hypothetical protein
VFPDKAKATFARMKNDLIAVKGNWEKSGNGDGDGDGMLDEAENSLIDTNDKSNFLNGKSSAILNLRGKSDLYNLLSTVVQMFDSDTSLDTAADDDDLSEHFPAMLTNLKTSNQLG